MPTRLRRRSPPSRWRTRRRSRAARPDGLRRRAPPARAHRIRPHRRRGPRVCGRSPASRASTAAARRAHGRRHHAARLRRTDEPAARAQRPERDAPRSAARSSSSTSGRASSCARWWLQRDARHAVAAHRAHDAVLAQPLRVEPAEGALRARSCTAQNALLRATRSATSATLLHAASKDPAMLIYLDNAQQPQGAAERELRARGDGALHARRGQLHRARRQGSGARVHRLEPRPRHRRVPVPPRACTTTA